MGEAGMVWFTTVLFAATILVSRTFVTRVHLVIMGVACLAAVGVTMYCNTPRGRAAYEQPVAAEDDAKSTDRIETQRKQHQAALDAERVAQARAEADTARAKLLQAKIESNAPQDNRPTVATPTPADDGASVIVDMPRVLGLTRSQIVTKMRRYRLEDTERFTVE